MRTPSGIATFASICLTAIATIEPVINQLLRTSAGHLLSRFLEALLEAALLGLIVWIGTYIGARMSPVHQRTTRFMHSLAVTYMAIGVVLTIPVKTHAVIVETPQAAVNANIDVAALLLEVGLPILLVVAPFFVTRIIAAICAPGSDSAA
jgi:hypothetical protein